MTSASVAITVHNEQQTRDLAGRVAALLPRRALIGLAGPLGSGKTRFVQGLAAAVGVPDREVTSPTFVLCHRYLGPGQCIYHVDAYRLKSEGEWWDLGVEEWLGQEVWVVVEWADRVEKLFTVDYLMIRFDIVGETDRVIHITSHGSSYEPLVRALSNDAACSSSPWCGQ